VIPFAPTKGEKDGAWRGGAAFVGSWGILWFLGVMTPLPVFVTSFHSVLGSFVIAFALLGLFMSMPYAWLWIRGKRPESGSSKGVLLYELSGPNGQKTAVYNPAGPSGWSPPLNKGISRSLDTRNTIWRELTWVAPVTVGDVMLTAFWNLVLILLGRTRSAEDAKHLRGDPFDHDSELA
jgi:hypothetical protein